MKKIFLIFIVVSLIGCASKNKGIVDAESLLELDVFGNCSDLVVRAKEKGVTIKCKKTGKNGEVKNGDISNGTEATSII